MSASAEGAAEDVGEVLGGVELGDGGGVLRGGGFEVAVGPAGEPDEGGGRAAAEVVVGGAEVGSTFAVGDGAGEVAARASARPARYIAAWAGRRRNSAWSCTTMSSCGRSGSSQPSMSSRSVLDAVDVADDHAGADQREVEHRAVREDLAREGVEPAAAGWRPGGPDGARGCRARRARRPCDVVAGHARGGSPRAGRRWRRTSRWRADGARRPGRGARRSRRARSTSPKRWWYRYHCRRLSSATRKRFDRSSVSRIALASLAAGDRCAQRSRQPAQDRGLQEERPDVVGLAVEDLVDEVVDDEPVVTGEARR